MAASASEAIGELSARHRYLRDYLIEEVLSRLDPPTLEFLERCSILERLSSNWLDLNTFHTSLGLPHALLARGREAEALEALRSAEQLAAGPLPPTTSLDWWKPIGCWCCFGVGGFKRLAHA
jgi:hypothetical protein